MRKDIVAVDLFCSIGGLTRGLLDAGIKVKKGYDIDKKAKETYERNNEGVIFIEKDICDLSGNEMTEGLNLKNNFLLLAGCAPCQPFSAINNSSNSKDKRRNLILKFGQLIKEAKPDFIFVENVPGLRDGKGRHIFKKFESLLRREGYIFSSKVIDAKEYGVPQKRKRLILLGSKIGSVEFPSESHGPNSKDGTPFITVREAISKYPKIRPGKKSKDIPNHKCRNLSEINKKRLQYVKKDGGSRKDIPKELQLRCHNNYKGHNDVYGRMKWDDVAPTLTCKCTSISNGRFGHPSQLRGISVREAAALQTFSDDYLFYGGITESTKWVGNAVPVRLAKVFGNQFIHAVSSKQ